MNQVAWIANEALKDLSVEIDDLHTMGDHFQVEELAFVSVRVVNTIGLPLRDVVVEGILGDPSIVQFHPMVFWDGNGAIYGDMEPGAAVDRCVSCIRGVGVGAFTYTVRLTAEVVPLGVEDAWFGSFKVLTRD